MAATARPAGRTDRSDDGSLLAGPVTTVALVWATAGACPVGQPALALNVTQMVLSSYSVSVSDHHISR